MISQAQKKVCFCTLALGDNYRALALELAKDLEQYSPNTPFVVLTDKPHGFREQTNVLAFNHRQQSIGCYHDKRFVIAKALSRFDACIFIDADMRILAPIPQDLEWQPGITAYKVWTNIPKHNKNEFEIKLMERMAQKLNLNLEKISFVHECLFVVTKDSGKEQEFLKWWDTIAPYFELNGWYRGEGHTIGLAAGKTDFNIRCDPLAEISFFKDKLEMNKIKKGSENYQDKSGYFERQRQLEYPQRSLLKKSLNKLEKLLGYLWRISYLRLTSLKSFDFYYR